MVNKPLIRPYFWGGVALGGVARIPMIRIGEDESWQGTNNEPILTHSDETPKFVGEQFLAPFRLGFSFNKT